MPSDADGGERRENPGLEASPQAERIRNGLEQYGDAFLAYLMLDGVDQTDPEIVVDFVEVYAGWYPDRMTFMREQLSSLGWLEAIVSFRRERDIEEEVINFNWERIWAHCLEVYRVEERLTGLHVFFT